MLVILSQLRFTQLTGLWLMITFTIYLSNKLTISLMSLIHVLSLLITAYSFKARDLTSQFTQFMQLVNPNHSHTQNFQTKANHCINIIVNCSKTVKFAK